MAKLNIDIVLIDESVVMNGFRVLMSGATLDNFIKNPVMLFMHNRAMPGVMEPADKDVILPVGKWYDIRVEGQRLLAKPDFDETDDFAMKIQGKVQGGYLNGASIWIDPITTSDDTALMVPGQKGPTVTEWGVLEASIVDIPNCNNALAIRNSAGKKLLLSASESSEEVIEYLRSKIKNSSMDNKLLAAKLGLSDTASEAELNGKLAEVVNAASKNTQLAAENTSLKNKLVEIQDAQKESTADALVDGGVSAGKFPQGDRDKYKKLAMADFETTKALIDSMKPYKPVEGQLAETKEGNATELAELMKLSGRDLYMQDKLGRLKELSMEQFKLKYKEAFKVEFKG